MKAPAPADNAIRQLDFHHVKADRPCPKPVKNVDLPGQFCCKFAATFFLLLLIEKLPKFQGFSGKKRYMQGGLNDTVGKSCI